MFGARERKVFIKYMIKEDMDIKRRLWFKTLVNRFKESKRKYKEDREGKEKTKRGVTCVPLERRRGSVQ